MIEKILETAKMVVRRKRQKKALNRLWEQTTANCQLKPLTKAQLAAIDEYWGG